MTCPHCGGHMEGREDDETKSCDTCDHVVEIHALPTKICPSCGAQNILTGIAWGMCRYCDALMIPESAHVPTPEKVECHCCQRRSVPEDGLCPICDYPL